ncbi:MAG: hypothetical protein WD250_05420 [Egibacteraceae bacterium]
MVGGERSAGRRLLTALRPLGWPAVGMLAVSAVYGAFGVLVGERLPQLSTATTAAGMPVRLVQSTVVFGIIGLAFVYLESQLGAGSRGAPSPAVRGAGQVADARPGLPYGRA